MKKTVFVIGICVIFMLMPAISAFPTINKTDTTSKTEPTPDYDGTFVGGIGLMYKEDGEWQFDYYGYLGGVYKNYNRFKFISGKLFDLDQVEVGSIKFITARSILVGRITNLDGQSAPIVGFLIYNDVHFAGRLMSLFGPAPHIWGQFTPN